MMMHGHLYWDQASVLGLLDPAALPVVGVEDPARSSMR
jgi:hypothetical protein